MPLPTIRRKSSESSTPPINLQLLWTFNYKIRRSASGWNIGPRRPPDKEYLVYSDRDLRFTWKEFNERVDRMAKGMLSIGIKHGTHVGIWATNVPDWLTFLYAAAKIGAVAVTVNTNYKQSELEFLVENADIHTLCITDGVFDGSYVDMVYTMLPELKESQRGYLKSKRFPVLKNVVYIGQEEIQRNVQHSRTAAFRRKRQ